MDRAVIEEFNARQELREPPRRTTPGPEERVRFDTGADFDALTARALRIAGAVLEPYAGILKLLRGCEPASTAHLRRAERRGASWRQLCAIAHRSGFTFEQRQEWYRVAAGVPLSARHCQLILDHLSGRMT